MAAQLTPFLGTWLPVKKGADDVRRIDVSAEWGFSAPQFEICFTTRSPRFGGACETPTPELLPTGSWYLIEHQVEMGQLEAFPRKITQVVEINDGIELPGVVGDETATIRWVDPSQHLARWSFRDTDGEFTTDAAKLAARDPDLTEVRCYTGDAEAPDPEMLVHARSVLGSGGAFSGELSVETIQVSGVYGLYVSARKDNERGALYVHPELAKCRGGHGTWCFSKTEGRNFLDVGLNRCH